jgi:hypothetical protein
MRRTLTSAVLALVSVSTSSTSSTSAQSPTPGFRLYGGLNSTTTHLVDDTGTVVHTWSSSFPSGVGMQVLADGTLLRGIATGGGPVRFGGVAGGVQRVALDGTVLWDYRHHGPTFISHHDLEPLPNGNVLLLVWEQKTAAEAVAAGRDPALLGSPFFYPDSVVEVQPTGPTSGIVVWEWRIWDHLVQDFDPNAANYGVVAAHPELLDINFPPTILTDGDWNHANGIDYDPIHDWIILSFRPQNEVLIIDHGTTADQAAGHTGGRWGKGGDILYRWGNPAAYRAGTEADRLLGLQHAPRFIPPGYEGAGNVTIFNNVHAANASAVLEIALPVDARGNFVLGTNGRYGPVAPVWTYSAPGFYSAIISGAERLASGNTLVCSGTQGRLFEVTPGGQIVWEYQTPANGWVFQASHVERTLWAHGTEVSAARGGSVAMDLIAGSRHAAEMYLVLGSSSGSAPGLVIGNIHLPLNFDPFLVLTGTIPNTAPFSRTLGLLDPAGRAAPAFDLPAALLPPEMQGLRIDFAAMVVDLTGFRMTAATNAVRVVVNP